MKPDPFTKDHKWDEWAETFKEHLTLLPSSTGLPLACVMGEHKEPEPSPTATDEENFISMAELSGKTFKIDSEKAHQTKIAIVGLHLCWL